MDSLQKTSGFGCAHNPGDYMFDDPASACPCLYQCTQQQSSGCQCQGALRTQVMQLFIKDLRSKIKQNQDKEKTIISASATK